MSRVYEIYSGTCSLDENFLEIIQQWRRPLSRGEDNVPRHVIVRRVLLSLEHFNAISSFLKGTDTLNKCDSLFLRSLLYAMDPITLTCDMLRAPAGELRIGTLFGLDVYAQADTVQPGLRLEPWGYTIEVSAE